MDTCPSTVRISQSLRSMSHCTIKHGFVLSRNRQVQKLITATKKHRSVLHTQYPSTPPCRASLPAGEKEEGKPQLRAAYMFNEPPPGGSGDGGGRGDWGLGTKRKKKARPKRKKKKKTFSAPWDDFGHIDAVVMKGEEREERKREACKRESTLYQRFCAYACAKVARGLSWVGLN